MPFSRESCSRLAALGLLRNRFKEGARLASQTELYVHNQININIRSPWLLMLQVIARYYETTESYLLHAIKQFIRLLHNT
jgi:hypothetical protein